MAKIVFKPNANYFDYARSFNGFFKTDAAFLTTLNSSKEVAYQDVYNQSVILTGTGFTKNSGGLTGGTITSITFLNGENEVLAKVKNVEFSAKKFDDLMDKRSMDEVMESTVLTGNDKFDGSAMKNTGSTFDGGAGNDRIIGANNGKSGFSDYLTGGRGNDKLTGNGGNDLFFFVRGDGRDVITDFDAKGGYGKQDFISIDNDMADAWKATKSGNDTLIKFGDGDSILLKGVAPGQISDADFLT